MYVEKRREQNRITKKITQDKLHNKNIKNSSFHTKPALVQKSSTLKLP